jgi:NADH dehydrogenase FAD-containing subunit
MDACLRYRGILPPGFSVPLRVKRRQKRVYIARCQLERTTIQGLAPSQSQGVRPEQQIFSVCVRQAPNLGDGNARAWWTSSTGVSLTLVALVISCAAACFVFIRRRLNTISATKRVVVLGGGFAGITLARELAHTCAVTLIDVRDFFEYVPGVPGAIVGSKPLGFGSWALDNDSSSDQIVAQKRLAPRRRLNQLHRTIKEVTPISTRFLRIAPSKSVIVRHGTLDVPLQGKSSSTTTETINWDYLVFATGSLYPSPLKPSASYKSERAEETAQRSQRAQRIEHFASAASKIARARHVMIIGGGIVGVELAADLANAEMRAPRRITLVHGGPRLMDDLPVSAGERATKWLRKHGVNVLVGEKFVPNETNADETTKTYKGVHSGTTITPDEVIVATGARPATEFLTEREISGTEHLKVPLDGSGRIRVDPKTFRVDCNVHGVVTEDGSSEEQPEIYAIGDCAAKPADQYLASYAHWEAEYVASRILRGAVAGSYKCPPRLICVSLGPNDGLIIWGDRILRGGFFAALFKLVIEFWFKNFLPAPYGIFRHLPNFRD